MVKPGIDVVWGRITRHAGQTFNQKAGRAFTYTVESASIRPSTTNQILARSQFEKALDRMPVEGPGHLTDLRGPSYLWAILSDARIRRADW